MNQCSQNRCKGRTIQETCDNISRQALAMAYVPWQYFENVYEPDKALKIGTIFPELNKPFYGKTGGRRCE